MALLIVRLYIAGLTNLTPLNIAFKISVHYEPWVKIAPLSLEHKDCFMNMLD